MLRHRYHFRIWSSCVVATFFVWILGCSQSVNKTDSVQVQPITSKQIHDFGVVRLATISLHTFQYQNPYESAIEINGLSASCGCVRPSISTRRLDVGEILDLEIAFTATDVGDVRQNVTIVLEGRRPQEFPSFDVSAKVRDNIHVVPERLLFESVGFTKSHESTLRVENHSDCEWSDISVMAPDWIRIEIQRDKAEAAVSKEARQSWTVGLNVDGSHLITGSNTANVIINAQPQTEFSVAVPIIVEVQPPFVVLPKKLILSHADNKQVRAEARIFLASQSQQLHAEEIVIKSSHDQIDTQVTASERGEWLITISVSREMILEDGATISVHIPSLSPTPVSLPILPYVASSSF